ncbi:Histidine kinase-, DNA gyrase B-, and HSP90-like ATPase [uncultured archaeon]|nr:Histidine kinase-, DNA gyrase B-, and HSP90-like ATPase [uncultured archaeon]
MSKHRLRDGGEYRDVPRERGPNGGTGANIGTGLSRFRKAAVKPEGPCVVPQKQKLSDTQFADLFRLIFTSVAWGVRGPTIVLRMHPKGPMPQPELEYDKTTGSLLTIYRRFEVLSQGMSNKSWKHEFFTPEEIWSYFSIEEIRRLGLNKDDLISIPVARELASTDIQNFKKLVPVVAAMHSELYGGSKGDEDGPYREQLIGFGAILSDCLEKLLFGRLDFDANLVVISVGQGRSSLLAQLGEAGRFTRYGIEYDNTLSSQNGLRNRRVTLNPVFCKLIFANVISNAKRASENWGRKPTIRASAYEKGNHIFFEIRDTGHGMTKEVMDKLNAGIPLTVRDSGQFDLDFPYCRQLAKKMGGALYVKESSPEGTTVVLELQKAD